MKKFAILIAAAVIALSSCIFDVFVEVGNGVTVQKTIEVDAFNAISVPHSTDVYYTQTLSDQELVLTCDENLVDYYNIRLKQTATATHSLHRELRDFAVRRPLLKHLNFTS